MPRTHWGAAESSRRGWARLERARGDAVDAPRAPGVKPGRAEPGEGQNRQRPSDGDARYLRECRGEKNRAGESLELAWGAAPAFAQRIEASAVLRLEAQPELRSSSTPTPQHRYPRI